MTARLLPDADPSLLIKRDREATPSQSSHAKTNVTKSLGRWKKLDLPVKSIQVVVDGSTPKKNDEKYTIPQLLELGVLVGQRQRRENQRRYRKKKEDMFVQLERDTQQLRAEIQTLRHQQVGMLVGVPAKNSNIWDAVVEYFRLFRRGLQSIESYKTFQEEFVLGTMATDLAFDAEYGTEAVLRGWYFLQWFGDVEVELEGLQKRTKTSLSAITRTSVTITGQTLTNVFPHLFNSENSNSLAGTLLGQRIVMSGSAHFEWDNSINRVTNVISQSDMLTPMLHLLGSLEDRFCGELTSLSTSNNQARGAVKNGQSIRHQGPHQRKRHVRDDNTTKKSAGAAGSSELLGLLLLVRKQE
ncbi:hypothetical protein ON010_g4670 [Phytophthora cinnamomi]|nr:hypothetical protein ON010_g4670 [Phytophthora cinnamomi]